MYTCNRTLRLLFMQACNLDEAKVLYDQLAVVTPIVMALSAAAPIYRGYLCEVDCRWDVISAAVDDRTDEVSTGLVALTTTWKLAW